MTSARTQTRPERAPCQGKALTCDELSRLLGALWESIAATRRFAVSSRGSCGSNGIRVGPRRKPDVQRRNGVLIDSVPIAQVRFGKVLRIR